MKNSNIEWCDHTFNPWEGCTKVSPGCAHCYAETRNARFGGGTAPNWGKGAPRRRTSVKNWNEPLRWNAEARKLPDADGSMTLREWHRPRVFCASLADWLDDEVPIEWLADLLNLIRSTPNLDWLLLTKRPQNWKERLDSVFDFEPIEDVDDPRFFLTDWILDWYNGKPPANVWIGTTVEDDDRAWERHHLLMDIPARVHYWSSEPMLSRIIARELWAKYGPPDWEISGGESGPSARPMHPDWPRARRDQCKSFNVRFLFKQWGEWFPVPDVEAAIARGVPEKIITYFPELKMHFARVGKKVAGRELDGVEHNEFPEAQS